MKDEAIVIGPCQESKPICIGCFTDINLDDQQSYKRCSTICPGSHLTPSSGRGTYVCHSQNECDFLSASLIKKADPSTLKTCFYAITPLRLLMVKQFKPELWKVVEKMEAHTEIRRKNEKLWKMNEELAVEKIQKVFGLSSLNAEEIHFSCGVLEVNAFEVTISPNHQPLRAIYPNAYLFSHDCVPNTCHSTGENFSLVVKTLRSIPKKSPITVSYTYTLQSTLNRRKHLQETKFFSCCCQRCSDVTEFGLYCSAFKCQACKSGLVLPKNPLDNDSDWMCEARKCSGNKISATAISTMCQRISDELDAIGGNDLKGYENFLTKYSSTLHENHYLCLSAMHSLFQLYGKIRGYIIDDMTEEQLERKIQICRKLLRVFEKLEPGYSKQRGVLLYELQAPLMIILRRRFEQQNVGKKELKQKLREINKCLEESSLILGTEWIGSAEGEIAAAAKTSLESMKNWESVIDMI
ncbi:UNVERIFIED_CONTAM: hypothetical protein PYX00_003467 [Menopon gallinae]|uniref:SET domain-containing protein n=1 Tax=Menopon gallinae TaxID=328185 RepID=A0AAW2I2I7_9NEOP